MFRLSTATIVIAAAVALSMSAAVAQAAKPAAGGGAAGAVEDWGVYGGSMSPDATRAFAESAWAARSNPVGDTATSVKRASSAGIEGWDIGYTSIIGQTIDEFGRCDVVAGMVAQVRIDRSTRAVTAARQDLGHARGICEPLLP